MKCPLMPDKNYSVQLEQHLNIGDCLKEECAWWNKRHGVCSIEVIGSVLEAISCSLADIASKTPLRRT